MNKSWPLVPLGEVLRPTVREEAVDTTKEYRLLGIRLEGRGPFHRETVTGTQTSATKLFRVEKDDFIYSRLFACRGAFGVIARELDGCYVSGEFPTFVPASSRIDVDFLRYWFRLPAVIERVNEDCTGSTPLTRNRFKEQFFLTLAMPLPPLAEQRRIVARIEELADQISEARTLRQRSAEEAAALWARGASVILDRTAEHCPVHPLEDLIAIRGGGTPSKSDPYYWEGSIPWITPKDMKVRELRDAIDHISDRATKETAAKIIDPGAVLVVVRGMILAHTFPSAVLRVPAAINQDMKALLPKKELLPEFLCAIFWAYNSRIVELVEKSTHDTRKLETDKLLATKIVVPPIEEQHRIVAELDALQADVDGLRRLQTETAAELDALLPAVLDRAFKGEL